mgnify:CR=1 FL=1
MDGQRRTIGETKEALEFMAKVDQLSPQQRDQGDCLGGLCERRSQCFNADRAILVDSEGRAAGVLVDDGRDS